jgi:hypothetical protein
VHTIIIIGIGLALLAACAAVGRLVGGQDALATSALVFLPLWLAGAAINMYIGVRKAGYSISDETPVFLVVFLVPAALALLVWWKLR